MTPPSLCFFFCNCLLFQYHLLKMQPRPHLCYSLLTIARGCCVSLWCSTLTHNLILSTHVSSLGVPCVPLHPNGRRVDLHCRGWRIRAPWQCGQPPRARRWSGPPTRCCRPQRRRPALAELSGGQELSISAGGPPWHPWKGGHSTGQGVRSSVNASQAAPHSVGAEERPGDEQRAG